MTFNIGDKVRLTRHVGGHQVGAEATVVDGNLHGLGWGYSGGFIFIDLPGLIYPILNVYEDELEAVEA